jgi:hypothetical protein
MTTGIKVRVDMVYIEDLKAIHNMIGDVLSKVEK